MREEVGYRDTTHTKEFIKVHYQPTIIVGRQTKIFVFHPYLKVFALDDLVSVLEPVDLGVGVAVHLALHQDVLLLLGPLVDRPPRERGW